LETNWRATRIFEVPHVRATRKGTYKLNDPRDIYENMANQGSRRLRACILQAIPSDVIDKAVEKCKETITKKSGKSLVDRTQEMVLAFSALGINVAHIEKKLKHPLNIITEDEMFDFITIYNSIKDNHAKRGDFFDILDSEPTEKTVALAEKLNKGKVKTPETKPSEIKPSSGIDDPPSPTDQTELPFK
jgi:hypothetical protein